MIDGSDLPRGLKQPRALPEPSDEPGTKRRVLLADLECDMARLARDLETLLTDVSALLRRVGELELTVYNGPELPRAQKTIHLKRVWCGDYICPICALDGLVPPVGGPAPASTR